MQHLGQHLTLLLETSSMPELLINTGHCELLAFWQASALHEAGLNSEHSLSPPNVLQHESNSIDLVATVLQFGQETLEAGGINVSNLPIMGSRCPYLSKKQANLQTLRLLKLTC